MNTETRIAKDILTEQAEQITEQIRELTNQPQTSITQYRISALTLAITYIIEAAAVIDAMTETINKYQRKE